MGELTLYHASHVDHRSSIAQAGLRACDPNPHDWERGLIGVAQPVGVYLSDDPVEWAYAREDIWQVRVDAGDLRLMPDPLLPGRGFWVLRGDIAPDRVELWLEGFARRARPPRIPHFADQPVCR